MEKKVTDYEIMNDYFLKSNKYDNGTLSRNSKMAGNIFAMIIKKYIKKILENTEYDVSINNSYIEGIRNEWDLLIIKKNALDDDVNIYNQNDVKCIIELKTATFFKSSYWKIDQCNKKYNCDNYENDIKRKFSEFDNIIKPVSNHCRYLYISLFQNPNHNAKESLEKVIDNMKNNKGKKSTFFFRVDTRYDEPNSKNSKEERNEIIRRFTKKDNEESFKEFILESVKY